MQIYEQKGPTLDKGTLVFVPSLFYGSAVCLLGSQVHGKGALVFHRFMNLEPPWERSLTAADMTELAI